MVRCETSTKFAQGNRLLKRVGLVNGKPRCLSSRRSNRARQYIGHVWGAGENLLGESPRPQHPPPPLPPALVGPEGPPGAGHAFGGVLCGLFQDIYGRALPLQSSLRNPPQTFLSTHFARYGRTLRAWRGTPRDAEFPAKAGMEGKSNFVHTAAANNWLRT